MSKCWHWEWFDFLKKVLDLIKCIYCPNEMFDHLCLLVFIMCFWISPSKTNGLVSPPYLLQVPLRHGNLKIKPRQQFISGCWYPCPCLKLYIWLVVVFSCFKWYNWFNSYLNECIQGAQILSLADAQLLKIMRVKDPFGSWHAIVIRESMFS